MQAEPQANIDEPGVNAWYAVYTRHQHERSVARSLAQKEFEVFLPLYHVIRRWKDRTRDISLPLFPCYVILRGNIARRLDLLSTPGVNYVLSAGGHPAQIAENEIRAIRRVVDTTLAVEPCPFLRCGDMVRVISGPLAGIEGVLVRKKTALRLVLSVSLLERSVAVEVDSLAVERLPARNRGIGVLPAFAWSTS